MSPGRARWTAIAVALAASACSLIVDSSGIVGDAVSTGDLDAASPDAPPGDGLAPGDASGDGAVDGGPEGGRRFCEVATEEVNPPGEVAFCDDFDDPGRTDMASTGWSQIFQYDLGEIQGDDFFSSPRASRFGAEASGGRTGAAIDRLFPGSKTAFTVSMRIRPHPGYGGGAFRIDLDNQHCAVQYYPTSGELQSLCGSGSPSKAAPSSPTNLWTRVSIRVARGGPTGGTIHMEFGEGANTVASDYDYPTDDGGVGVLGQSFTLMIGDPSRDVMELLEIDDVFIRID